MIDIICDIIEVLDKIWYERNQVSFQGKQAAPHQVVMAISKAIKENRQFIDFQKEFSHTCKIVNTITSSSSQTRNELRPNIQPNRWKIVYSIYCFVLKYKSGK